MGENSDRADFEKWFSENYSHHRGGFGLCEADLEAAYAAGQARGQQEPLTDERIDTAIVTAYRGLVAEGFNGGMVGRQWDHALARAIEREVKHG